MARTFDETLRDITKDYLARINPDNPPSPAKIKADILDATRLQIQLENTNRDKGPKQTVSHSDCGNYAASVQNYSY